jgi:hypothetical protein
MKAPKAPIQIIYLKRTYCSKRGYHANKIQDIIMTKQSKSSKNNTGTDFTDSLIADAQGRAWLKEQIYNEGPPHKQAQHALVLERIGVLINQTEAATGKSFQPVAGEHITLSKHDHSLELPLGFPDESLENYKKNESFIDKLTKGPDHEIAYTATLLQAIEWLIQQHNGK